MNNVTKMLNVNDGYDYIKYCTVCGSDDIQIDSLDNGTIAVVSCKECNKGYQIDLRDEDNDEENDDE